MSVVLIGDRREEVRMLDNLDDETDKKDSHLS